MNTNDFAQSERNNTNGITVFKILCALISSGLAWDFHVIYLLQKSDEQTVLHQVFS